VTGERHHTKPLHLDSLGDYFAMHIWLPILVDESQNMKIGSKLGTPIIGW